MISDRNHLLLGSMTSSGLGLDSQGISSSTSSSGGNNSHGVIGSASSSSSFMKAVGSGVGSIGSGSSLMSSFLNQQTHSQQQQQQQLLHQINSLSINSSNSSSNNITNNTQQSVSSQLGSLLSSNNSSVLSGINLMNHQGFSSHQRHHQQQFQPQQTGHAILGQGSTLSNQSTPLTQSPSSSYEFAVRLASEANHKANTDKDYYEAIKLYGKAICLHSNDARFFLNRSYCYAQLELFQLALDDADSAISLDNKSGKAFFRRAQALLGLKKYPEAEKSFQEVLQLDPDCMETAKELINLRLMALSGLGLEEDKIRSIPLTLPSLELVLKQHSAKSLGWEVTPNITSSPWDQQQSLNNDSQVNGVSKAISSSLIASNSGGNRGDGGWSSSLSSENNNPSRSISFDHHQQHLLQQESQQPFGQNQSRGVVNTHLQQQTGVIGSSLSSHSIQVQQQNQQHNKQQLIGSQLSSTNGFSSIVGSNGSVGVIGSSSNTNNGWRAIERPNSSSPQQSNQSGLTAIDSLTPVSVSDKHPLLHQMASGNNNAINSVVGNNNNRTTSSLVAGLINSQTHHEHHLMQQINQAHQGNASSVLDGSCISSMNKTMSASGVGSSSSASSADQLLNSFASNGILNSFASAAAFNSQVLGNNSSTVLQQQQQELLFRQQQQQQQQQLQQQQVHQQQQIQSSSVVGSGRHPSGGSSSGLGSGSLVSSAEPPSVSPSVSNTSSSSNGDAVSTVVSDQMVFKQEAVQRNNALLMLQQQQQQQQPNAVNNTPASVPPPASSAPAVKGSVWGSASNSSSGGGTFADIVKKKAAAAPAAPSSINTGVVTTGNKSEATGWGEESVQQTQGDQNQDTNNALVNGSSNQTIMNNNVSNAGNTTQSKRPTNIWGYNGMRVGNVSASASKSTLHTLFSKFGRVKMIDRITNKNVDNQIWVFYDNPNSPVDAIAKYQGVILPGVSLNNTTPLKCYFAATDDQKDLKFSRPKQPQDNRGECYYWRTTNCFSRESCSLRHIPACKNIGRFSFVFFLFQKL